MRKISIILFLASCAYFFSPYIAVFNLYIALKTGDTIGVKKRVNWSLLKKDLRIDLDNLVEIKIKENLNQKKIAFSFGSLSLSKNISDKIATPEGLIYLFNKPNEFVKRIRQAFKNAIPPEKINPAVPEKKSLELEGPNIQNLFERIKYAFFKAPDIFRLSFNEGGLSFLMDWQLRGTSWKLIHLKIPIENI